MVEFKFLGFFFSPSSLSSESHSGSSPGDALRSCLFPGCEVLSKHTRKFYVGGIYTFMLVKNFIASDPIKRIEREL